MIPLLDMTKEEIRDLMVRESIASHPVQQGITGLIITHRETTKPFLIPLDYAITTAYRQDMKPLQHPSVKAMAFVLTDDENISTAALWIDWDGDEPQEKPLLVSFTVSEDGAIKELEVKNREILEDVFTFI